MEAGHGGALLADAARGSPESLAEALAELLGAEPALKLVRGALDHLESRVSRTHLASMSEPAPVAGRPSTRQPEAPKLVLTTHGESNQLIFEEAARLRAFSPIKSAPGLSYSTSTTGQHSATSTVQSGGAAGRVRGEVGIR